MQNYFQLNQNISLGDIISTVSIVITIIIFLLTVYFNKKTEQKRFSQKLTAVKFLLNEELKLNYWAYKKHFDMYKILSELLNHPETSRFTIEYGKDGTCYFKYIDFSDDNTAYSNYDEILINNASWNCFVIPDYTKETYEKLALETASLDINLSKELEGFYSELADFEHYKDEVIKFITKEYPFGSEIDPLTEAFIHDLPDDMKDFYESMNKLSFALTAHELREFKLR